MVTKSNSSRIVGNSYKTYDPAYKRLPRPPRARGIPAMHHRLRRLVLIGSIACVPALGTLLGVAGPATASTATTPATHSSPSAQAAAAARNAIKQLVIGEHGNNHLVSGRAES